LRGIAFSLALSRLMRDRIASVVPAGSAVAVTGGLVAVTGFSPTGFETVLLIVLILLN